MIMPFPGMDPYLENPVLWTGLHTRLIVAIANQLQPLIRLRYIASIEQRVYMGNSAEQCSPHFWIQERRGNAGIVGPTEVGLATPVVLEAEEVETHEKFIEILDRDKGMRVTMVIELVSPANKNAGPGRESNLKKQRAVRQSKSHLVEIDLLRRGRHVLSVPRWLVRTLRPYQELICVNRRPTRTRYEVFPCLLRQRLPRFGVPLSKPDPDVPLDVQGALKQVYQNGGYALRRLYDRPCRPPLRAADRQWANDCWVAYQAAYPEPFTPDDP